MSANIKFVVNTIARVSDIPVEEFEDSEDEELDETFEDFWKNRPSIQEKFPYKLARPKLDKTIDYYKEKLKSKQYCSKVVEPFLKKLKKQAFTKDENKVEEKIAVCFFLNRMLSVSYRKNRSLYLEASCEINSEIQHRKFARFWGCSWKNSSGSVPYEKVQKFYKQLKKYDKIQNTNEAGRFLNQTEDKIKFVPYQHLREDLKNHHYTKELIDKFKEENNNERIYVYLSIIDEDTVNFNGVFSDYVKKILNCENLPQVISTGYVFPRDNYPLYVASEYSRQIRISIAKEFPFGVYYPEPNMCILVPEKHNTVPYTFIDPKRTLESPVLLENIITEARNQNKHVEFVFFNGKPITTKMPERAEKKVNFSKEFKWKIPPTDNDIRQFGNVTQSDSKSLNWLHNLFTNGAIVFINNLDYHVKDSQIRDKCRQLLKHYNKKKTTEQEKNQITGILLNYIKNEVLNAITRKNTRQYCTKLISNFRKTENSQERENYLKELKLYILPETVDCISKAVDSMKKCIERCKAKLIRNDDDEKLLTLLTNNNADVLDFIDDLENQGCTFKDSVYIAKQIPDAENVELDNLLIFSAPKIKNLIEKSLIDIEDFMMLENYTLKEIFCSDVLQALEQKKCTQAELLELIEDYEKCDYFIDLLQQKNYSVEYFFEKYRENPLHLQFMVSYDVTELVLENIDDEDLVIFALDNYDIDTETIMDQLDDGDRSYFEELLPPNTDQLFENYYLSRS